LTLARFSSIPLVALAALTACQATETAEQMQARMQMESDSVRVVVEAKAAAFATAVNNRQADAIAALYAADATVMPPDMPAVAGRDNIRATFEAMLGQFPEGTSIRFEIQDVTANGPLAMERGAWIMTGPTADGGSSETRGKYLIAWQKVDGEWMISKDIWNNDAPMPPM
jgi:uncharacterized protein (TIGR02246 family)